MSKEWDILHTSTMPVIALRGLTVFPNVLIHFEVAREASVRALEAAMTAGSPVFLVGQKDIGVEKPGADDLYQVGTISNIRQILRMPGDNVRVMVEGAARGSLLQLLGTEPHLEAEVREIQEASVRESARTEALMRSAYELFQDYAELSPKLSPDLIVHVLASQDPGHIADYIAQNIPMRNSDKQSILEELRPVRRLEKLYRLLEREVEILTLDQEIQERAKEQVNENQRDYYLREQLKAIQAELGEEADEIEEYREKIAKAKLPDQVREKLNRELGRLTKQSYSSSESTVLRNYLDICLELPWGKTTREKVNVAAVNKALDQDHFGLDKVKKRVLEFVAVRQLAPELKGQVICLVGPPGVGKTSIAMSMARAMNRKLARISLGGVSDEAEIRGHRKTYVGAMPGRIITAINQTQSCNPLILLDEIDKLGHDHRGDPSSALLEVLDSEQNRKFRDHYLEVPVDLSEVLFVTTANTLQPIPRPLLDRMEVIEVSSYTENEKMHIATEHLIPKQLEKHGLDSEQLSISKKALWKMARNYTKEAGVRQLERKIGDICRKAAREILEMKKESVRVTERNLSHYLGKELYIYQMANESDEVGIVRGLAWTSVGGDTLQIEVNIMPGEGEVLLTGQMGDVMKESARTGISYIRSVSKEHKIDENFFKEHDIHIHIPEGAVPKDGPSAGITMATAMMSAITGRKARADIAMTGEITLRGRVLPIGGLKEKLLAAKNAGIKMVIIPKENVSDVEELSHEITRGLKIVPVSRMDEVLKLALGGRSKASKPRK